MAAVPYNTSTSSTPMFGPAMPIPNQNNTPYVPPTPLEAYYLGATILTGAVPSSLPNYSPDKDVAAIRDACHGMGTRNGKLIKTLVGKTAMEIQVLQVAYRQQKQKDMLSLLKEESSGVYKTALVLLASSSLSGDAYVLKQALNSSKQTKLQILAELVISKDKEELELLRKYLLATKQLNLTSTINATLTSENKTVQDIFKESLNEWLSAGSIDQDFGVLKKYLAGDGDRSVIYPILLSRTPTHLNQLVDKWRRETFNQSLGESLSLHFNNDSDVLDLLLYAVGGATGNDQDYGVWRDAQRIEDAIARKNELLLTIRIIRAHWDSERFTKVIAACNALRPGKATLVERVGAATSGNLKTLLKEVISYAS